LTDPFRHPNETPERVPKAEESNGSFRPLIFGETLFDYFPDGTRVLGGAPFNVAWHLRGFKADPLMVTAVGDDPDGREILERMASWGLDTSAVQVHPTRPTGRVTARLDGDQPRYEIEAGQAYDEVDVDRLPGSATLDKCTLLYHGSLALREEVSARSLTFLRHELEAPTLVDVNLRAPWWSPQNTPGQIVGADWVKVNMEEAGILSGRSVATRVGLLGAVEALRESLEIRNLVVTLGAEGALAVTDDGVTEQAGQELVDTVDTVGAGDAFSAVLAVGIHRRWPLAVVLRRASEFAAELCRMRGAIPEDPDLYRRHLERWDHA
jgi:fructokinase